MPEDVDRWANWDYEMISWSQSMHLVASVDDVDITFLKLREFSCFYLICMDDNFESWEQKVDVKP
jgi:hypothetical protein